MNNYTQAQAARKAHADAVRAALAAAAPADRPAVLAEWRERAAALPDLRRAELADLADAIARAVAFDLAVFDLPELPALFIEPRNWLAAGGLSKRGRAALDAITPTGYSVTVSARSYSYEVNAYRTADGYHGRQSRSYWQHGEGTPFTYERTEPRTLEDLIAADAELIEVQRQIRDLEARRSELTRSLTV
jgi:hypothetical protein